MILEAIAMILAVIILAVIINGINDYCKQNKRVTMSFKEAMDLVELPIVTFYNNGNKFNFLLDTGASLSVIDSNVISKMNYKSSDIKGTIYGMEGNPKEVTYITAPLEYKGTNYSEEFQVLDMSSAFNRVKVDSGVTLSGILGSHFFKKYQYVLDFEGLIAYSKK